MKTIKEPLVIGKSLTELQLERINELEIKVSKLKAKVRKLQKENKSLKTPKQHWMLDKPDNPFYRG